MNPETDAPLAVRKRIAQYGGLNPFGKPNWRVCLAQHVMKKSSGIFHNWAAGELSMFDVDSRGRVTHRDLHPDSVRSGLFEIPRYEFKGWIIERWMPARIFGTREAWNSQKAADGSCLLGDYPNEGGYYMMTEKPFDLCPSLEYIENGIREYERERNNCTITYDNFEMHVAQAMRSEQAMYLARKNKLIENLEHLRKNGIEKVMKSGSLSAQRIRQRLAAAAGQTGHAAIL